jgi:hypothetical protein
MQCAKCGAEARGRILYEMWHGLETPGFGGFVVFVGAWSCGTHAVPLPSAEEARYFAQRFLVAKARPPEQLRVGGAFVAMNETEGRELEQDPEALLRKQVDGSSITIEHASPADWASLQREVRARDDLLKSRGRPSALRGMPWPK